MPRQLLLLVLLLLCVPALAQEGPVLEARDTTVVEVPAGERTLLRVGPIDELVVLEASRVSVIQFSGDLLQVDSEIPGGRAVLMVRQPTGLRTLIVRAAEAPRRTPTVQPAVHPSAPELALGGSYSLGNPSGGAHLASLQQWLGWSQVVGGTSLATSLAVERGSGGQWGLRNAVLSAESERTRLLLGDLDLRLLPSVPGGFGSGASLRGGRASLLTAGGALEVGVLGGAGRSLVCCDFFAPDSVALGALTARFDPGSGWTAEALGGASRAEGGALVPLSNLRLGYEDERHHYELAGAQTGNGGAAVASASVAPSEEFRAHARAGLSSRGFHRSVGHPSDEQQVGVEVGGSYRPRAEVALDASVRASRRTPEERDLASSLVSFDGRLHYVFSRRIRGAASYRRFSGANAGRVVEGDGLGAALDLRPTDWLGLGGSSHLVLVDDASPLLTTGLVSTLRLSDAWGIEVEHRGAWDVGLLRSEQQTGALRLRVAKDHLGWITALTADAQTAAGELLLRSSLSSYASWRIRAVELTVAGSWSPPLADRTSDWGVSAGWTLRPGVLARSPGTVGLRGSARGTAYIDVDHDGVRDEGEEGLSGLTLRLDGRRTVTTDADGRFVLRNLPIGVHRLRLDRQALQSVDGVEREVEIRPLEATEVDFALDWGGRIRGQVFVDMDGDGTFGEGDLAVHAGRVLLRDERRVVVASVEPSGGRFDFSGLSAGAYEVVVDPLSIPEGYRPVDPLEQEVVLAVAAGEEVLVRLEAVRAIGGVVWQDADRDGEGGGARDLGAGGIEVQLSDGRTATTGPDGTYLFRDLPPGAYAVTTELGPDNRVVVLPPVPREVLGVDFVFPPGRVDAARRREPSPSGIDRMEVHSPVRVLPQGIELQLTASATLSSGQVREVTASSSWTSSDEEVLSVRSDGVVRGDAAGFAGVTAEYRGEVADPAGIEVLSPLESVQVSPVVLRLNPGNVADLRVTAVDQRGRGGDVTPLTEWEVADPRIAAVEEGGRLRAFRDGTTTLRARVDGAWSAPLQVTVVTARVTALSVSGLPARMPVGTAIQLRATGYESDLQVRDVTHLVHWESTDPSVVTVDDEGFATAVGPGRAQVRASMGSVSTRSLMLIVTNTPPLALQVVPELVEITLAERGRLRARATFEDGSQGRVTEAVQWTVSGPAVVIDQDGTVIPFEAGEVTVTASYLGVKSQPVRIVVRP